VSTTIDLAAVKRGGARRTVTRWRWDVVVGAVAMLLAALAMPVAGASAKAAPDLGTFAGYEAAHGDVRSVQGSWVVPRVVRDSSPGDQSLIWVAAQGVGSPQRAPFIQVGVADRVGILGNGEASAFWSDTAQHFRLQPLKLRVKAGDRLRASLTLTGGRWHVVLDNLSTHRVARVSTAQESRARFDSGQWIEEDPTLANFGSRARGVPFARTSTVRFSALDCNGAPPTRDLLYSLWMSLPHAMLGPTPLVGDSFAVVPRRLSLAATRYLTLVTPEDSAASAFAAALASWLGGASSSEIDPLAARLTGELHAVIIGLSGPGWPISSANARASLVAANRRVIERLAQVPALPPSARRGWAHGWARLTARVTAQGQTLRNVLGAPDITPYSDGARASASSPGDSGRRPATRSLTGRPDARARSTSAPS